MLSLFGDANEYDEHGWDFHFDQNDNSPPPPISPKRRCANKTDEFMNAIVDNDLATARNLLPHIDVNATDEDGETPLTWAAYRNLVHTASMLIAGGADINRVNRDGWSALLGAASQGHAAMCRLLLSAGANAILGTKQGNSPMHMAAWKGHHDTVRILLETGTHVDELNNMKQTALMLAAKHGNVSVVEVMVYSAASLDLKSPQIDRLHDPKDGITAAYHAIRGVDEKSVHINASCLEMLIAFGASDADLEDKIKRMDHPLTWGVILKSALDRGRRQRLEAPQKLRIELLRLPSQPLLRDLCNIVIVYVLGIV